MDKGGLTHTFEKHPDYCVLSLSPAMNSAQWSEIEKVGDEVLRELEPLNTPKLIVDLSELDYIGSAMVALVVRIWKMVKSKRARMVVVNRNEMVLEVFKIAKLDAVWEIVEFREDALDRMGVSREAKIERRESNALMIVTILAALVSVAALAIEISSPGLLVDPFRQILIFACSGVGVVMGLLFASRSQGGRKVVGILATLASLGVLIAACFLVPIPLGGNADPKEAPAPAPAEAEKPTAAEKD